MARRPSPPAPPAARKAAVGASARTPAPGAASPESAQALAASLQALLAPLAQLAVSRGLPHAALDDALKRAMVDAAAAAHALAAGARNVSRISTVTGLNRREVTRLTQAPADEAAPALRTPANEVFTRWIGDKAWRDRRGAPRALPRLGPAPSFEALAQSVTRDVNPRSLLDELLRLKLARLDTATDTVAVDRAGFVPGDDARMLGFLGANVGDHLRAAVANVRGDGRRHFEQAVFADGLSDASLKTLRTLIAPQWQTLMAALVPALQQAVERDADTPQTSTRRMRIGLYTYDDEPAAGAPMDAVPPAPARRRRG